MGHEFTLSSGHLGLWVTVIPFLPQKRTEANKQKEKDSSLLQQASNFFWVEFQSIPRCLSARESYFSYPPALLRFVLTNDEREKTEHTHTSPLRLSERIFLAKNSQQQSEWND